MGLLWPAHVALAHLVAHSHFCISWALMKLHDLLSFAQKVGSKIMIGGTSLLYFGTNSNNQSNKEG